MALREVGLLVFSQGFALSRDEYIIRELAFYDWTGHHHVLFKYLLPTGVSYEQLSETARTRVDRQTQTEHGLPFEPFLSDHNRQDLHAYHRMRDDIHRWCQRYLTPDRGRIGVHPLNGMYRLLQEPRFRTPSRSWKGRVARTWPIYQWPLSMSWPITIMAAIGVRTIVTENVGSGTIVVPKFGPVR